LYSSKSFPWLQKLKLKYQKEKLQKGDGALARECSLRSLQKLESLPIDLLYWGGDTELFKV